MAAGQPSEAEHPVPQADREGSISQAAQEGALVRLESAHGLLAAGWHGVRVARQEWQAARVEGWSRRLEPSAGLMLRVDGGWTPVVCGACRRRCRDAPTALSRARMFSRRQRSRPRAGGPPRPRPSPAQALLGPVALPPCEDARGGDRDASLLGHVLPSRRCSPPRRPYLQCFPTIHDMIQSSESRLSTSSRRSLAALLPARSSDLTAKRIP